MSNALAISATTLTLQSLLAGATPNVTVQPPDRARGAGGGDQLNLFLYQTAPNAAWRNAELPGPVRTGEANQPPLPLTLRYLITAYADDEAKGHAVLGRAMSVLHDHMLLSSDDIRNATLAALPESDLHRQLERVRITLLPLGLEDWSKLWSGFQTQFRLSAAYEVSVVLIESTRPKRSPLPVLRQGSEDRGPFAVASGAPFLESIRLPDGQRSGALGSLLTLTGTNLTTENTQVMFRHPQVDRPDLEVPAPRRLVPQPGDKPGELSVTLPDDAASLSDWLPGFYTVSLRLEPPNLPAWNSNELPFGLAPSITVSPLTAPAGNLSLTLTCRPRLHREQRVLLLFGDRQVEAQSVSTPADPAQPSTLTFQLNGVTAGEYVVRLRVDGVDSLPVVRTGTPPRLEFDPNQKMVIS